MSKKLRIAIAGLGSRGWRTYGKLLLQAPEQAEIVAIADIKPEVLAAAGEALGVPEESRFESAEKMLEQDKLADLLIIATQDRQHVGHALPALEKGYAILLEKPISPELNECNRLAEAARHTGNPVIVCHVLRYTPFFTELKEVLDSGIIGEIGHVAAMERVGYWHQAHSFVRGNWRRTEESSPMILAKCCHDLDLYPWLVNKRCQSVSSGGGTYVFRPEKAPAGAAKRCLNGCAAKENCPYDAEKIYLDDEKTGLRKGNTAWPVDVLTRNPTEESILEALKTGPYGRCVYHCDNDVVDNQALCMTMEDGSTMSFTMCGLTKENEREARFMGSLGEIHADMESNTITVMPFVGEKEVRQIGSFEGHGGGDTNLVKALLAFLCEGEKSPSLTTLEASLQSHYIALGAEKSRQNGGEIVRIADLR